LQNEFNKNSIAAKVETPWKYSFFVDVTFEKYADYVKTKALLEIMAEYFKVLGNIKTRHKAF
jgi:prephenate dehydratase